MTSGYRQTYDQWRADPQAFWRDAAREIAWIEARDLLTAIVSNPA